ncbi:hypothetical protein FraQA3DRAFT_3448, partial [Frankia sp. QA3]
CPDIPTGCPCRHPGPHHRSPARSRWRPRGRPGHGRRTSTHRRPTPPAWQPEGRWTALRATGPARPGGTTPPARRELGGPKPRVARDFRTDRAGPANPTGRVCAPCRVPVRVTTDRGLRRAAPAAMELAARADRCREPAAPTTNGPPRSAVARRSAATRRPSGGPPAGVATAIYLVVPSRVARVGQGRARTRGSGEAGRRRPSRTGPDPPRARPHRTADRPTRRPPAGRRARAARVVPAAAARSGRAVPVRRTCRTGGWSSVRPGRAATMRAAGRAASPTGPGPHRPGTPSCRQRRRASTRRRSTRSPRRGWHAANLCWTASTSSEPRQTPGAPHAVPVPRRVVAPDDPGARYPDAARGRQGDRGPRTVQV